MDLKSNQKAVVYPATFMLFLYPWGIPRQICYYFFFSSQGSQLGSSRDDRQIPGTADWKTRWHNHFGNDILSKKLNACLSKDLATL